MALRRQRSAGGRDCEALPAFIGQMEAQREWTGSTPDTYARRMAGHVYDFILADGQKLGDLTVDQVTEQMIGAVLDALRTTGGTAKAKSLAVQEQIRSPLLGARERPRAGATTTPALSVFGAPSSAEAGATPRNNTQQLRETAA